MATELAVIEQHAVQAANPLDAPPAEFRDALQRRGDNRKSLMAWIREALVEGTDFGKIHFFARSKCDKGSSCKNSYHFSKPVMFKPGAEKICGMLGITPTFPTLHKYEEAVLEGRKIESIILRCHLLSADGRVVADGIGARSLESDNGDLNKALKMASKSAHIDATLRMAGLSEVFTQDLEDMKPPETGAQQASQAPTATDTVPSGKHRGKKWSEISDDYLGWAVESDKAPAPLKSGAQAEIDKRTAEHRQQNQFDGDEDIPFDPAESRE